MGKIISVNNQKGGVAKSTTVQALGQGLSAKGYKVLLIDLDPQCNLSFSIGGDKSEETMYEVLSGDTEIKKAIITKGDLDLIPGNLLLSSADLEFTRTGKEYLLKESLTSVKDNYNFIIIDTPPALGILSINSLTACDKLIIPISADIYSLQGIGQLSETIESVRKYVNSAIKIEGILLTRHNPRTILSRQIKENAMEVADILNTKLFKSTIRESVAIKEAQAQQTNLFEYATNNAVLDYKDFVEEILESEEREND